MFLLRHPSRVRIEQFLHERASDTFSYPEVGGTRQGEFPNSYNVDHNRLKLGSGDEVYERAKMAVRSWQMFKLPGLELIPAATPIESGRNVALLASHLGFYSLHSCRIVYVIDERSRFGFAYGTLTEHVEIGEERFTVEIHPTGEVWYDILAFSKPGNIFVKLGYLYARFLQKRFASESKAAMKRAVTAR